MAIALLTTLFITISSLLSKYLTQELGLSSWNVSFTAYTLCGIGLLIGLLSKNEIDISLLIIGTIGSIINTLGLVLANKAFSIGPLGPVGALLSIQSIFFTVL